jgi:hypothetical protein
MEPTSVRPTSLQLFPPSASLILLFRVHSSPWNCLRVFRSLRITSISCYRRYRWRLSRKRFSRMVCRRRDELGVVGSLLEPALQHLFGPLNLSGSISFIRSPDAIRSSRSFCTIDRIETIGLRDVLSPSAIILPFRSVLSRMMDQRRLSLSPVPSSRKWSSSR